MITPFDYRRRLAEIEDEVMEAVKRVLHSNRLVLGPETEGFEREFATAAGAVHAIGVSSGTRALELALAALGIGQGDEVITVSNTCVPTIAAIRATSATPVFVDVREADLTMDPLLVEAAITERTRCILPVHLHGNSADMDAVLSIARARKLRVVEDCAQAFGTRWGNSQVGTFGDIGCFSFYPTKNLGAYGDAGAVITNDPELGDKLKRLRTYGLDPSGLAQDEGANARINEIQAAILRVKLNRFDAWMSRRIEIAAAYRDGISNSALTLPAHLEKCTPSYHQYVLRSERRDDLKAWLHEKKIITGIHYPVPVHRMPAYAFLGGEALDLPVTDRLAARILSLPVHDGLTPDETHLVIEAANSFPG